MSLTQDFLVYGTEVSGMGLYSVCIVFARSFFHYSVVNAIVLGECFCKILQYGFCSTGFAVTAVTELRPKDFL